MRHRYPFPGIHTIRVKVTDSAGLAFQRQFSSESRGSDRGVPCIVSAFVKTLHQCACADTTAASSSCNRGTVLFHGGGFLTAAWSIPPQTLEIRPES